MTHFGGGAADGQQNQIPTKQNSRPMLQLLRARSAVYDSAQRLYYVQIGLTVGAATFLALLKLLVPTWNIALAVSGLAISLMDVALLDPLIKKRRFLGAKFQEAFDCDLFGLEWREARVGSRPAAEDIEEWAHKQSVTRELRNWYAADVGRLPLPLARIACQRSNARWNSRMRRRYSTVLAVILTVVVMTIFIIGAARGQQLMDVAWWLATIAPFLVWIVREMGRQRESADLSQKIADRADALWKTALATPDSRNLEQESRELQNDIFDQRRADQPVMHMFYTMYRDDDEYSMRIGVAALVKQYESSLHR